MKLLQLNVEGRKHVERVTNFITTEKPDVIALQEVDESLFPFLTSCGYTFSFLPKLKRRYGDELVEEGEAIAARNLQNVSSKYFYREQEKIVEQDKSHYHETTAFGYIIADCVIGDTTYTLLTTHLTWAPEGNIATPEQTRNLELLLEATKDERSHILCGDFNIPRHRNPLYKKITPHYTDAIPSHYESSLDKELHRLGDDPTKQNLFTDYMVDYIFTKPPYIASNVQLHFGVSDHAAVTATIEKT